MRASGLACFALLLLALPPAAASEDQSPAASGGPSPPVASEQKPANSQEGERPAAAAEDVAEAKEREPRSAAEEGDVDGDNAEPCLCVFDIDRTLTGKQGLTEGFPRNRVVHGVKDWAYGGGTLTLSALAAEGLSKTFCTRCYLGVVSAGDAGGADSPERAYFEERVLVSGPMKRLRALHPSTYWWSHHSNINSPLVVRQPDRRKQDAVAGVHGWYAARDIVIKPGKVFFFDDRTENIPPFAGTGFNARQVSCGSRDQSISSGMVGLAGATPEEIVMSTGVHTCDGKVQDLVYP